MEIGLVNCFFNTLLQVKYDGINQRSIAYFSLNLSVIFFIIWIIVNFVKFGSTKLTFRNICYDVMEYDRGLELIILCKYEKDVSACK